VAIGADQNILRFEVTVNNIVHVQKVNGQSDCGDEKFGDLWREATALA